MKTRDILLLVYGAGWLIVLIITAVRGPVPAELWGVLAIGLGAIMAAFRVETTMNKHIHPKTKELGDKIDDVD